MTWLDVANHAIAAASTVGVAWAVAWVVVSFFRADS